MNNITITKAKDGRGLKNMKQIPLTQGKFAKVDDEDFEWLNQFNWHFSSKGYAVNTQYIKGSGSKNQKNKIILMHRLINHTPIGFQTDHINRNKLDNRRNNLRTVNNQQNHFNMPLQKNSKSKNIGVFFDKNRNRWTAHITYNNKYIFLGRFNDKEEAIKIRIQAEQKYFQI